MALFRKDQENLLSKNVFFHSECIFARRLRLPRASDPSGKYLEFSQNPKLDIRFKPNPEVVSLYHGPNNYKDTKT
jgi:hypothetical protein